MSAQARGGRLSAPLVTGLLVAVVVLSAAWWGRARDGRKNLAEASAALVRGDRVDAIVYARAAAQARCPWCEAPELGYAKLYAIAREAESRADDSTAVVAWQAVRAATLTTIWLGGEDARRRRADQEIARLQHRLDAMSAAAGATSPAANEERLRAALAPAPVPSTAFFAVVAAGALLLFAGAARSLRARQLRAQDVAVALAGGALAVLGVVAF